jgi:hypothetical protein
VKSKGKFVRLHLTAGDLRVLSLGQPRRLLARREHLINRLHSGNVKSRLGISIVLEIWSYLAQSQSANARAPIIASISPSSI